MRRRYAALLAAILLVLTGCQPGGEQPGSTPAPSQAQETEPAVHRAQFALPYDDTDTLDPLTGTGSTNLALAGLVYEGLFELDQSFQAQPVLCASSAANEDCTVWTFTLRAGVTFSDGTPLTAAHAAASLNAARSSPLYAARLAGVSSVAAGESETGAAMLTVTLASPNGALPALLDIPITLSGGDGSAAPLGTGPYRYDASEGELCLTVNPLWWQGKSLPLEQIALRAVSTADDRIAAFDTGLVTVTVSDLTGTNALGYSGSYETWDCPTTNLLYLGFNCASGSCRDTVLRQAISRGIDRTSVAVSLLSGHADEAPLAVHPASGLYDETLAGELTYSVSGAAELLESGGYTLSDGVLSRYGRTVELELVVNTDNSFRVSVAGYLAQELAKLGIQVTVTKLPWDSFLEALEAGDFDLYLAQVKLTAAFDPSPLITGTLNYGGYWSENTNTLLSAFRAASGAARTAAASALCADVASQVPFAPLCFLHTSVLTQWGAASGLEPTQQNPFYHFYNWTVA